MKKQFRRGKRLTLILLLFGLAVTVIYFFANTGDWIKWIVPFSVPVITFSHWFDPAWLFVPLALIALAGWMMLHLGRLFGRELIIGAMIVYLACNLVLIPFYSLIATASWQPVFLGELMLLGVCGVVYPILVLVALHIWNPRRK